VTVSDIFSMPVLILKCFVNQEALVEIEERCYTVALDDDV